MSIEKRRAPSPERSPRTVPDALVEKLGTSDIPFAFRTTTGPVYVADRKLRTVRSSAPDTILPPTGITVYLDPTAIDRTSSDYLSTSLLTEQGRLFLNDAELVRNDTAFIESFDDIPASMDIPAVAKALQIVVVDPGLQRTLRKIPVSLVPKIGFHPVEFQPAALQAIGPRAHIGSPIEALVVTNRMNEPEVRKSIEALVADTPAHHKAATVQSPEPNYLYLD